MQDIGVYVRYNVHMAKTKTITITEARKRIFEVAEDIIHSDSQYFISEHGTPKLVLMSIEEYESWLETMTILAEDPDIVARLKESEAQIQRGEIYTLEEVHAELGLSKDNNTPRFQLSDYATNLHRKRKKTTDKTAKKSSRKSR